jgi:Kef-type K+ transport system membrane component KefB
MEQVWFSAALWLILALIATLLSIWFRISTALSEIVVGTVAQLIIGAVIGTEVLGAKSAWVGFLAGTGANRQRLVHAQTTATEGGGGGPADVGRRRRTW